MPKPTSIIAPSLSPLPLARPLFGPPIIMVTTRSQSGAMPLSRILLCKSGDAACRHLRHAWAGNQIVVI
jgi:hypothetical protein